jgi:hypothetical protein
MTLNDIRLCFNRALALTFNRKKLIAVFTVLLLCGILVVFFRGLALEAGQWITLSLTFLPVFLCAGVLLATGIVLIRVYHDEIKKRPVSFRKVLSNSWNVVIGASYISIPIILSYLLLWMMLGVFFLLNSIPGIGQFFGVILAFAPFLLNLGAIVLCVLSLAMLFYVTPAVALRGLNSAQISQMVSRRFQQDVFLNLVLAGIGLLPLAFILALLVMAAMLTGAVCYHCDDPVHIVLQWFFMMIPFTALLTPAIVFFFNFAAESHVMFQRAAAKR